MSDSRDVEIDGLLSQVGSVEAQESSALSSVTVDETVLGMLDVGEIEALTAAVARRTQRVSSRAQDTSSLRGPAAWGALAAAATLVLAVGFWTRLPKDSDDGSSLLLPEYSLDAPESDATDRATFSAVPRQAGSVTTSHEVRSFSIGRRLQFVLRTQTRSQIDVRVWLFSRNAPQAPLNAVGTTTVDGGTLRVTLQTGPGAYQPKPGADELVFLVGRGDAVTPSFESVSSAERLKGLRRYRLPVVWLPPASD